MALTDITHLLTGVSASVQDLYQQIGESRGQWSVKKVKFDKKLDGFLATAQNPKGEKLEGRGPDEHQAVLNLLMAIKRRDHMRSAAQVQAGMWTQTFTDQLDAIAAAYAKAPVYDPKAAAAFKALADDCVRRAHILGQQIELKLTYDPDPYKTAQDMLDDVRKRRRLLVSRAGSEHPIWTPPQVEAFRAVWDVLGVAVAGAGFGWDGCNRAFAALAPIVSAEAQGALFTEVIARVAYGSRHHAYGPEKIALFPEFYEKVQRANGFGPGHHGIHPSQTPAPVEMPGLPPLSKSTRVAAFDPTLTDPNAGYQSGIPPLPNNAYLMGGDPLQKDASTQNASLIDTHWAELNREDPGELARMKQAITNAFRVVLLSPRKDLRANCHDVETEALTDRGWLSYFQIRELWDNQEDLKVAAYRDGQIVYESPRDLIAQEYQGEMIAFKGRYLDILVTPNHRMLLADGRFVEAAKVMDGYQEQGFSHKGYGPEIPTAGLIDTACVEEFIIPGCLKREREVGGDTPQAIKRRECALIRELASSHTRIELAKRFGLTPAQISVITRSRTSEARHETLTLPMESWLKWLGWYIAEGWLDGRNHAKVCQSSNSPVLQAAQEACTLLKGDSQIRPDDEMWVWSSRAPQAKQLGLWIKEHVGKGARNKRLPKFLFDLPPSQIELFLHALLMGDGTGGNGWKLGEGSVYSTASVELANDLQRLCAHCGVRTILKRRLDTESMWNLSLNPGRPTHLPPSRRIPYDGLVWCFTMPSGTMITRRYGRPAITGNSIHYQHISGIPGDVTDPTVYWNTLEQHRQNWNVQRFGEDARFSHRPYAKLIPTLQNIVFQMNPSAGYPAAKEKTEALLQRWETEEQDRLMREDEDRPEDQRKEGYEISNAALKAMVRRVKGYIREYQPELDHYAAERMMPGQESMFDVPAEPSQRPERYPAWMGSHLKAIAQVSQHVDGILEAALQDVEAHDGAGHHFRAYVLQQNISGVGPKVCSFAWLLLQPMTSQLATIDTHILDVLGHKESDMSRRDYFKFERELQAGRDAAGYGTMPLGQYQWAQWDNKRTGTGTHQDHSAMRVLDPKPHDTVDWASKAMSVKDQNQGLYKQIAPRWWRDTEPARQQVGDEFDRTIGSSYPRDVVPYQTDAATDAPTTPISAYGGVSPRASGGPLGPSLRTPWFLHPESGERISGKPGDTIMRHATGLLGLSTPAVWQAVQEAGKE